jgi:hypothetical protein
VELPFYNVNSYGSLNCKLVFYYTINKTKFTLRDVQILSLQHYKLKLGGNVGGGGNGGDGGGDDGSGSGDHGGGGGDHDGGGGDHDGGCGGGDDDDSSSFDHPSSFMNKCK